MLIDPCALLSLLLSLLLFAFYISKIASSLSVSENNSCLKFVDHSLSHIYVKVYIVPEHKRATKRKTPLLILERKNEKANSKNNVKSFDSEDEDSRKGSAMQARRKIVSSLRRGSQFSLKKKKDNDQGNVIDFMLLAKRTLMKFDCLGD